MRERKGDGGLSERKEDGGMRERKGEEGERRGLRMMRNEGRRDMEECKRKE